MTNFKLFFERRIRNPLRKEELISNSVFPYNTQERENQLRDYYINTPYDELASDIDKVIRRKYESFLKNSKSTAEKYIVYEVKKQLKDASRISTKPYKKIYEYMGVQVFLDVENVNETDYSVGSYNYKMIKRNILVMIVYIRDILPNKKPKILITSLEKHPYTGKYYDVGDIAMAGDKLIFLDQYSIDNQSVWVHEYAHWVADLIPKQTQVLLQNSFWKLVETYYKKTKKRNPLLSGEELSRIDKIKISKKLGFPEYGLENHDEFFAVLIEHWKQLPNNMLTYKIKSLVKSVLTRL